VIEKGGGHGNSAYENFAAADDVAGTSTAFDGFGQFSLLSLISNLAYVSRSSKVIQKRKDRLSSRTLVDLHGVADPT
jgi:hypothetical protein